MPIDRVVTNASPLITLFKSRQAELLPKLFGEIVVPGAVWNEVLAGGPDDPASHLLPAAGWARREQAVTIPPLIQAWDLGVGESEVLSFALDHKDYFAVIDDAAARRCARSLGIGMIGTAGLLVLAKRRGIVAALAPHIQALRDAGLWLSDDLVSLLMKEAGE